MIVYKAKDGWRWRLKARNGRIVAASSEAFSSRRACWRNVWVTFNLLAVELRER